MAALAVAAARLLVRSGWLAGLFLLEVLLFTGFWFSGPLPFGEAFDRRAAEADLLLLTLTSLPALFAGALLSSGDREDGMGDFYRACRVSPEAQVLGTMLGQGAVLAVALTASLVLSLALAAPAVLLTKSFLVSLGLGLFSTAVHVAWGVALGSWLRTRWAAVAGALAFWIFTVFALEALVTALLNLVPARWTMPVLATFLVGDPSQFVRVSTVFFRDQSWVYGPEFAPLRERLALPLGWILFAAPALGHLLLPAFVAIRGWKRTPR